MRRLVLISIKLHPGEVREDRQIVDDLERTGSNKSNPLLVVSSKVTGDVRSRQLGKSLDSSNPSHDQSSLVLEYHGGQEGLSRSNIHLGSAGSDSENGDDTLHGRRNGQKNDQSRGRKVGDDHGQKRTETSRDTRSNKGGQSTHDTCDEEDGTKVSGRNVKLSLNVVGDPGEVRKGRTH